MVLDCLTSSMSFLMDESRTVGSPLFWPLVRLTLNAKTAINRFRVSLKRVYYNDKLQGASDENALRTVHTQANELELMAASSPTDCCTTS